MPRGLNPNATKPPQKFICHALANSTQRLLLTNGLKVRILLGELSGRLCEPSRPGLTTTEPFSPAGIACRTI